MCAFQVLAQNSDGYVIVCQDCRAIQLAFGTTMIKVQPDHFLQITAHVRLEARSRELADAGNVKDIFVPLEEGMSFCLTATELEKLRTLLDEAAVIFETYQILGQY